MTRRQAVIEALEHREHETIPFHMDFTKQALDQLIAYTKDEEIEEKIGSCINIIQYWGWPTQLPGKPGFFQDEFGVIWNRNGAVKDIGIVEKPQIKDLEDYHYEFPVFDEKRLRQEYEALVAKNGDRFTVAGFGFCMFERAWSLMGMENVLMSMLICPDELDELFDRICDYYLPMIDLALEYDVDAVYFGDDWGQQRGLIMGPNHWRHFLKPRMARLYQRVKAGGKYVIQHSCGDCHEIFPDLIEIGKIDAAKLAELKVSVNDRYGYGTSQENRAQVSIGVQTPESFLLAFVTGNLNVFRTGVKILSLRLAGGKQLC